MREGLVDVNTSSICIGSLDDWPRDVVIGLASSISTGSTEDWLYDVILRFFSMVSSVSMASLGRLSCGVILIFFLLAGGLLIDTTSGEDD